MQIFILFCLCFLLKSCSLPLQEDHKNSDISRSPDISHPIDSISDPKLDTNLPDPTGDTDGDGILDLTEIENNYRITDWLNPDTDGDGFCDGSNNVAFICISGEDFNNNGMTDYCETDPTLTFDFPPANMSQSILATTQYKNTHFRSNETGSIFAFNEKHERYEIKETNIAQFNKIFTIDLADHNLVMYLVEIEKNDARSGIQNLYIEDIAKLRAGPDQSLNTVDDFIFDNGQPIFSSDFSYGDVIENIHTIVFKSSQNISDVRNDIIYSFFSEFDPSNSSISFPNCQRVLHFFSIRSVFSSKSQVITGILACEENLGFEKMTLIRNLSDSTLNNIGYPLDEYLIADQYCSSHRINNFNDFKIEYPEGYSIRRAVTSSISIAVDGHLIPQDAPSSGPYWFIDKTNWTLHIENVEPHLPLFINYTYWRPDTQ